MDELSETIVGARRDEAVSLAKRMLEAGVAPSEVLDQAKEGLAEVGRRFEREEAFIPELVMGGEIMRRITEVLKPYLEGDGTGEQRGTVVIGTVKGDIHDIGKDLVGMMLEINGYRVHDLGVDVPPEKFVTAIREFEPAIVGFSGLLTLAFDSMKVTIDAISAAGLRAQVKIMVGGGPVDENVQTYTGADGWGSDVSAAVKLAEQWTDRG